MSIPQRLKNIISLDYRSLALMRIGLGITLICDLINRSVDLFAFYTDEGVLPRSVLFEKLANGWHWSVYSISGMWQIQLIFFLIAFIAAVCLIVGHRTTLATLVSWILLVSLQNRNPLILQGGDIILRVVLFWSLFIPWGRYLSFDSLRTNKILKVKTISNAATCAYVVQIFLFYFFSGILKSGDAWQDGTAVVQVLHIDQFTTAFGTFLLSFPSLLVALSYMVIYLEVYGSLLLISPWQNGKLRTLGIGLFALMQIGLNLSLHLGLFGLISIVVTLGLLPSWFWDVPCKKFKIWIQRKRNTHLTIYYDGECGFCFKSVMLLKRLLFLPETVSLLPSTQDPIIAEEMNQKNSWIVITPDGRKWYMSEGLREILKASPLFFWKSYFFFLPGFTQFSNWIYTKIANKRLHLCIPEEKYDEKKNNLVSGLIIFLLICVVLWNVGTMNNRSYIPLPQSVMQLTRLDQQWNMFAPEPLTDDGWYVFPGMLSNGSSVDIFKNAQNISYEKPENVSGLYPNQRWQKYLMNLWLKDNSEYRLWYGRYLCRGWNKTHQGGQQLQTFQMIFMKEITNSDGSEQKPEPVMIWDHTCF